MKRPNFVKSFSFDEIGSRNISRYHAQFKVHIEKSVLGKKE